MDILSQIVRDVTLLVLITLFLELIIPRGELNGFVRMVMGLLLLAAVLNPILAAMHQESLMPPLFTKEDYSKETAAILSEGEKISSSLEEKAQTEYAQGLSGQVVALALLVEGVDQAEAAITADENSGAITSITLKIITVKNTVLDDALKTKLKKAICGFYGLGEDLLQIEPGTGEGQKDG